MGDDEDDGKHPRKDNKKGLNYFGLLLLFGSSSILFTPLLQNFPGLPPNAWVFLFWWHLGWVAIFSYSIILLIVNNVFRFLENRRSDRSTSPINQNQLSKIDSLLTSLLLWFALILILWTSAV